MGTKKREGVEGETYVRQHDTNGLRVEKNGSLVRGAGKPHRVGLLCRSRDGGTYVRGAVTHPDHATIRLDVWDEVFRNTEAEPVVMGRRAEHAVFDMTYLD